MNIVKATDYPQVYIDLGIDTSMLGCIMVNTEPIALTDVIAEDDYFYSEEHEYVQGNVSEKVPHATLLFGLMRSGCEMKKHVDVVLAGWHMEPLIIDKVSFFYGQEPDYITIIAKLKPTDGIVEGNQRLRLLPHIDTFGEYQPHITLAYVKESSSWEKMVTALDSKYAGKTVMPIGINYGGNDV